MSSDLHLDHESNAATDPVADSGYELETNSVASDTDLALKIQALLFVSEKPLSAPELKTALQIDAHELKSALSELEQILLGQAVELFLSASGYRLRVRASFGALIQAAFPERAQKLTPALLETLSIVAYKQPVTRADIEELRGVSTSSSVLRQLFDRGWITERGHRDVPGRPALLYTTKSFLDAFSLQSVSQLPALGDLTIPPSLDS